MKPETTGANKGTFPQPGKKLCGTPFVQSGMMPPSEQAQPWEPEVKPQRARRTAILPIVCAVLVLLSAILGYKAYDFKALAAASIKENNELMQENDRLLQRNSGLARENNVLHTFAEENGLSIGKYVASEDGGKYHLLSCALVDDILSENRIFFDSKLELAIMENRGYTPCSVCLP